MYVPSGLQATSTIPPVAVDALSNSNSHFFDPCIFHRLNLSPLGEREAIRSKSLSGHHDEVNIRAAEGNLSVAMGEKESWLMLARIEVEPVRKQRYEKSSQFGAPVEA